MAAVAAQPLPIHTIEINGHQFGNIPNPNTDRTYFGRLIEYLKGSNGAFRIMQLLERVSKAASQILQEMGSSMSEFFDGVASKLGLAWAMLTIPRLPSVTKTGWDAIFNPKADEGPGANSSRGITQRIHDVADAMAAWGYGLSLIFSSSALKNAADVPNFVGDLTDLSMAAEDYSLAKKHLEFINTNAAQNGDLQTRFMETMREALLRVVKAVASVVSGALGLLVLAFGGPVLPGAALLAIGLISTMASMTSYFYKESIADKKVVEFFRKDTFQVPNAAAGVLAF